jgi:hypothetical protein
MSTITYNTTRELLLKAELPQETRTYKPVTHQQLMDLTLESIHGAGFELEQELYSAARDGNIANGRYTIRNVADNEMQLQIGWQNSYDKSMSLKFAIGTQIFICSNGCVSGDYGAFKKAHKGEIQTFTPNAITEYIKQAGDAFRKLQDEREAMKNVEITKRTAAELVGRMLIEEQFIASTQVNIIARQLQNPSFDYGAPGSLWELYQHTTYAMKEVHPSNWMKNHIDAHSFFVGESGILTFTEEAFPPIALAEQIMIGAGDSQQDIEQFRQITDY